MWIYQASTYFLRSLRKIEAFLERIRLPEYRSRSEIWLKLRNFFDDWTLTSYSLFFSLSLSLLWRLVVLAVYLVEPGKWESRGVLLIPGTEQEQFNEEEASAKKQTRDYARKQMNFFFLRPSLDLPFQSFMYLKFWTFIWTKFTKFKYN